ncbi:hypothetical protein FXO37_14474 [Capsicum annuum]|nr:hypothetical protein FXO37_14474 [Capsicum annuum]
MRLGLFNGDPSKLEYGDISAAEVCSQEHRALALAASRNGIVLKNSDRLLPLSKTKTRSLDVIVPKANDSEVLLGNYQGYQCKNVTLLQGLQGYVKNTTYHPGCDFINCTSAAIDEAVDTVKKADYVVLVMGSDQTLEKEKLDRTELGLPVDVSFAKDNQNIGGILWVGYPGEAGAAALAEIISGEHNPDVQNKLHFKNLKVNKATDDGSVLNIDVSDVGSEVCNNAMITVKVAVKKPGRYGW